MLTFQDYVEVRDQNDESAKMEFVRALIEEHKTTELYKTAQIADEYDRHKNRTITEYQKLLYDVTGNTVPDNWSANFKMASKFFNRFVTQENQYLLGNGVTWENEETKGKLGGDDFDIALQKLGKKSLVGGVAFGFYNMDHLEGFSVTEYAPLYDEENGSLRAGARFWQIDADKLLRPSPFRYR